MNVTFCYNFINLIFIHIIKFYRLHFFVCIIEFEFSRRNPSALARPIIPLIPGKLITKRLKIQKWVLKMFLKQILNRKHVFFVYFFMFLNYFFRHQLAYGGGYPGDTVVTCVDDPGTFQNETATLIFFKRKRKLMFQVAKNIDFDYKF